MVGVLRGRVEARHPRQFLILKRASFPPSLLSPLLTSIFLKPTHNAPLSANLLRREVRPFSSEYVFTSCFFSVSARCRAHRCPRSLLIHSSYAHRRHCALALINSNPLYCTRAPLFPFPIPRPVPFAIFCHRSLPFINSARQHQLISFQFLAHAECAIHFFPPVHCLGRPPNIILLFWTEARRGSAATFPLTFDRCYTRSGPRDIDDMWRCSLCNSTILWGSSCGADYFKFA
jgi:hypothetical protein